jgi:hypothetical protein
MSKLRKLAEGKACQIRLVGICNGNPETTVLAHFRMLGIRGGKSKVPDWLGSWACSDCHKWVDTHKDNYTQLSFAHGVFRTQAALAELGHL